MAKTLYVYSTLSSSVNYPVYGKGGGDLPLIERNITIQGGANIPDKYMRTPDGAVITPVSEEDLAALEANSVFRLHKDNGFIRVEDKKHDGEKVAADMTGRDQSAPLVDADFEEGKEPVSAKAGDDKPKGNSRRA